MLTDYLDRLGWTQRYLAAYFGVSERSVQNWKNQGVPSTVKVHLDMICRLIGV